MEARLTIEGQMLGLSSSEFRKELGVAQREFQKDILKRVHLLKLRDEQICSQVINEANQQTHDKTEEMKDYIEQLKTERDQNQAIELANLLKAEKYSQLWYRKRVMNKCYDVLKNNWMMKKESKTFIKTKVEKFDYNHTSVKQLKERVDQQIETELVQKTHKIAYLEQLIREFEDQYKIEVQKRALVRNACDDEMKKGATKFSGDAMRMSMSTLRDLESKFLKTYQAQLQSQQKSTASKLERKMVFQPVTQ